ncbi:MAG: GIY-YIG nuclease family protein [Bacteroidales bacterium]|nr:GIY-YIG nuclease family protein [Bacteroidales bacterium]
MGKISAVYKITNTVTGECYVGSSSNVKQRWAQHKCPSSWKHLPNNKLYKAMQEYGVDKFRFQILCPAMNEYLKDVEQELIEIIKPAYNNFNAKGWNVERRKKYENKYYQSDKGKEIKKESHRKYKQSEKGCEAIRKAQNKWQKRPCIYNGKKLTFWALYLRFSRAGIEHPTIEAKKYLL